MKEAFDCSRVPPSGVATVLLSLLPREAWSNGQTVSLPANLRLCCAEYMPADLSADAKIISR